VAVEGAVMKWLAWRWRKLLVLDLILNTGMPLAILSTLCFLAAETADQRPLAKFKLLGVLIFKHGEDSNDSLNASLSTRPHS
jgi:hypothetical protein